MRRRAGIGAPASVSTRSTAVAGVVGPAAFIGAWATAPTVVTGYSSVHDAISRLAAIGADSRSLMTGGLVTLGLALPIYGTALRRVVAGPAWLAATATGVATLAVAATPLDRSTTVDTWHAVVAGAGYVTLAATPLLAAGPLRREGRRGAASASASTGIVAAAALALSATPLPTGLLQRLGLTAGHLWIAASGAAIATGRLRPRDRSASRW